MMIGRMRNNKKADNKDQALGQSRGKFPLVIVSLILIGAVLACNLGNTILSSSSNNAPTDAFSSTDTTFAPIVTMTSAGSTVPHLTEQAYTGLATVDPVSIDESIIKYNVEALVDFRAHTANVVMQAVYRNDTGQALSQIVFHVDPNRTPGLFTLTDLSVDSPVTVDKFTLTGPQLEIALKSPLTAGVQATFTMKFSVVLAKLTDARLGYMSYTDHQLYLGNWLPEIAPFSNGKWYIPHSWPVGEYTTSEMGNYHVKVTAQGSDHLIVVGPGAVTQIDARTWQFEIAQARTFTLCVSDMLNKVSVTSKDGILIDLYYFNKNLVVKLPDGSPMTPAQHALDTARTALDRFTSLFGPISYKRLVVIESEFRDGMEFSGMIYVGHEWFATYDGKPDSWLTLITAHEVAHQWWYSRVGNNQAETPYMDEAFAIYSELLYVEDQYPTIAAWWWTFRIKLYQPQGYVDSRVYEFSGSRPYINAVYLRGAMMFQDIRDMIGTDAFFKWWRDFGNAKANKIASPIDLWSVMTPADYARTAIIRSRYLRQPDPLDPSSPTVTPLPTAILPTRTATAPPKN